MQSLALGFVVLMMLAHVGCDAIFRFSPSGSDAATAVDSVAADGFPEGASSDADAFADSFNDLLVGDLPDGATPQPIEQTFCCADNFAIGAESTAAFTTTHSDSLLVVAVGILSDEVVSDAQLGATVHCTSCPGEPALTPVVTSTETSRYHAQLWYLANPPVGTFDVEAKTSHLHTFVALITTVWAGVDAANPFHGNGPNNTVSQPGGSVELQLDNCPAGAVAVDVVMAYPRSASQTPVSGQTISRIYDNPSFWLGTSYRTAAPPPTTMTWSSSAEAISAVADCLRAAR